MAAGPSAGAGSASGATWPAWSRVRVVTRLARRLGISHLTLFAFSEENWQRPAMEIRVLMALMRSYLRRELAEMQDNQIALKAIGESATVARAGTAGTGRDHRGHRRRRPDGPDPGPELRRAQ